MAKGAQCCCLVSLGPCKHRDTGLQSGKVGRDSAPLSESPFLHCSFHTTQLHSFQQLPIPSTPSGPGGDTALIFSSIGQVSQNVMTLLRQGPGGSLRDIWPDITWGSSTYVCREKPPGAQEIDIWSLPSQTSEIFAILSPDLWTEPSGWRVPSMIVLSILLRWFLNYAHSSLNRNPVLLPSHKLMG